MSALEPELTPLTGPVRRRPFIVCDIESKDDDSQDAGFTRPFMMGVYRGPDDSGTRHPGYTAFFDTNDHSPWKERFWLPGGSVDRAMRHVLREEFVGHHIYAHNAGRFDWLFLLPWLMNVGTRLGFKFLVIPVSSSIQVLDVWRGSRRKKKWRFVDSVRLIPTTLDKAAKAFGLEGKLAHDLNIPEDRQDEWTEYNARDCIELYRVLDKFHSYVEDKLHGEVGITAPATAVKIFRRNYLKRSYPRSIDTHAFVRSGYVGGHVSVFETECWGLRYYDVNSSYPASMLQPMPCGRATEWEGEPPARFRSRRGGGPAVGDAEVGTPRDEKSMPASAPSRGPSAPASGASDPSFVGFCECDVVVPKMHIPPLPVKHDGKLIFPTGKLRGVWDYEEIRLALEMGCEVTRWGKSVWFEAFPFFREYVTELYKFRDKSRADYDVGLAEIAKIMLNGSYGKFGMKTLRKKLFLHDDPMLPDGAEPVTPDPESPVWFHEEECDAPYIMPQISAHVTTLSRVLLYRKLREGSCDRCWPKRCHCSRREVAAYCDTDSVLTTKELETGSALGMMKDEIPEYSGKLRGRFLGPKTYVLSIDDDPEEFVWEGEQYEKVRAKGLEQRTRAVVELLERGETIFQRRLEKVGTLARAGFSRGPEMRIVPRRILETSGKRKILGNGSTAPYALDMWLS